MAISSETFNKFFSTIAQKIKYKLVSTTKHYENYLTEPAANTFILTPKNTKEIKDIIKTLNIRKSIGPNSIPTRLLKQFSKEMSMSIETLINLSFKTRIFPDAPKFNPRKNNSNFQKRRLTAMQQVQTYIIDIKYL